MQFPLKPIDWTSEALDLPEDHTSVDWPPRVVQPRLDRLMLYWELFEGDFDRVTADQLRVQQNLFYRIPVGVADRLTDEPPDSGDETLNETLLGVAYNGVIDMCRYGAALVWTSPDNEIEVLDPRYWVPTINGWVYGVPKTNPADGIEDRIEIMGQAGDIYYEEVRVYTSGMIGGLLDGSDGFQTTFDDTLQIVPLNPTRGEWGTSMFDAIGPAVIEIGVRLTDSSEALAQFKAPMMTARGAKKDINDISVAAEDPTLSYAERQEIVNTDLSETGFGEHNLVYIPSTLQDINAVTWDPHVDEQLMMVEEMKALIEYISRVPGLTGANPEQGMSGVALKIVHAPFYVMSKSIQNMLVKAIRDSSGIQVTWPHPFDSQETDTPPDDDDEVVDEP